MGYSIFNFQTYPKLTVAFHQDTILKEMNKYEHVELYKINQKYNGLCDLICNSILVDNFLGHQDTDLLTNNITVKRLNEKKIKNSHLLRVYSIIQIALAYLFGIYPDNIFSYTNQRKLVSKISLRSKNLYVLDRNVLSTGLKKIEEGDTLKLIVFNRKGLQFSGHSLLLKKEENNRYIFFDPNQGELRNLTTDEMMDQIDKQLKTHQGTNLFLTQGRDFLKRLS